MKEPFHSSRGVQREFAPGVGDRRRFDELVEQNPHFKEGAHKTPDGR